MSKLSLLSEVRSYCQTAEQKAMFNALARSFSVGVVKTVVNAFKKFPEAVKTVWKKTGEAKKILKEISNLKGADKISKLSSAHSKVNEAITAADKAAENLVSAQNKVAKAKKDLETAKKTGNAEKLKASLESLEKNFKSLKEGKSVNTVIEGYKNDPKKFQGVQYVKENKLSKDALKKATESYNKAKAEINKKIKDQANALKEAEATLKAIEKEETKALNEWKKASDSLNGAKKAEGKIKVDPEVDKKVREIKAKAAESRKALEEAKKNLAIVAAASTSGVAVVAGTSTGVYKLAKKD